MTTILHRSSGRVPTQWIPIGWRMTSGDRAAAAADAGVCIVRPPRLLYAPISGLCDIHAAWLTLRWHIVDILTIMRWLITPPPIEKRSIVMSVSVCVCVGVFVSPRSYLRNYTSNFFCLLLMAVAQSSSGDVVICYILPDLWMTSYLLISQGCSTSPPSWNAVHTQPWAWL